MLEINIRGATRSQSRRIVLHKIYLVQGEEDNVNTAEHLLGSSYDDPGEGLCMAKIEKFASKKFRFS